MLHIQSSLPCFHRQETKWRSLWSPYIHSCNLNSWNMFNTADGGKSADFPFKPGHYVAACSSGRWCQGATACLPARVWLVPWQARLQTHLSHGVHVGLVSWSVAWVLHQCHGCQGECGGGGVSVYQPSLTSVHLSNHLVLFIITIRWEGKPGQEAM